MMTKKIELSQALDEQGISLVVYGREECHLCRDMIAALHEMQKQTFFTFQLVDIDSDPELVARYGEKIPVLISTSTNQ